MTELGNRLKEARLSKGLSLDDLQKVTKIQKRYLLGIEEGNYESMPGSFYVRAFIKQYAEAVNLEPEEIFEQYKSEIPSTYNEDIPEKLSRVQSRKPITGNSSKVLDVLPKVLIVAFVIGALVVLYYFLQKSAGDEVKEPVRTDSETVIKESENLASKKKAETDKKENKQTEAETGGTDSETAEKPATQEITVAESKGDETTYELKNAEKFELKVVSTGETWVNILNGQGNSFFQGMLTKAGKDSETIDLSKETEAVIVIGNSTNTEVYVNDQKLEYEVSPTEQVRQDITIRYLKTNE